MYEAQDGLCGCGCSEPMDMADVQIDHLVSLFLGGAHDPSNWVAKKSAHHRTKSAAEAAVHAKVKRLIRKADPETRKPPTMRSRGFEKSLRKRMSGKVEKR